MALRSFSMVGPLRGLERAEARDPGNLVVLAGPNGAGKSTLLEWLRRSPEVFESGTEVLYVGPHRSWRASALNRLALYSTSGASSYSDVLKLDGYPSVQFATAGGLQYHDPRAAVHADAYLAALPHGDETILSPEYDGGRDLSVGQWQRVALARAFIRDAPLIILDEPTSSLDPRAEHDLFTRIRHLHAGRTVLLISHRYNTVRDADHSYVLADGQIEHGSHDQLITQKGCTPSRSPCRPPPTPTTRHPTATTTPRASRRPRCHRARPRPGE